MSTHKFKGKLRKLIQKAIQGKREDIDYIFNHLNDQSTFKMTRYVDYALSLVGSDEGISRIEYYLFNGTLIQRNYSSLYLNRNGYWKIVKEAYEKGLIDEIQAYAR